MLVGSRMWTVTLLLLGTCTAVLGGSGVVFDVTTVYDIRNLQLDYSSVSDVIKGRVHARTNARGLLLHDGNTKYITPKYFNLFNNTCNGILCDWNFNDWNIEKTNSGGICASNEHQCYWSKLEYGYDYTVGYRRTRREEGSCISKSKSCDGNNDCNDGTDEHNCQVDSCEPNGFLCQSKNKCIPLKWKCDNFVDCSDGSDESDCKEYVSATSIGQEMVSPTLTLPKSQTTICLALLLHYNLDSGLDILSVLAKDLSGTQYILGTVKSGDQDSWQVAHVNFTIPSNLSSPVNLIIKKVGIGEVKIYQITGCNSDGEEVEQFSVRIVNINDFKEKLPVYKVSVKKIDEVKMIEYNSKKCSNGGVMTNAGCACPPGFTGSNCEIGCGEYRFGQDCGGWCSKHLNGCRGFVLCSPIKNCQCAPGYKGSHCNQTCDKGWYGNDCIQQCGQCADGNACDIFTGTCSSCELGYVPPLCQQEYVYYSSTPGASSTDYGKITVTFNPKTVSGNGTPKLYQIQYSKKDDSTWHIYTSKIIPEGSSDENISEDIDGLAHGRRYNVRVLLMDSSFNKYVGRLIQSTEVLTKCDIPEEYDYHVHFESNQTSVRFVWTYVVRDHWCPVESYEVMWKEGWQWLSKTTNEEVFNLNDIIPGSKIEFKVRAKTCNGSAPYSQPVTASTKNNGSSAIQNLQMVSATSSSVDMKWKAPIGGEHNSPIYKVTFKCVQQPACLPGCVNVTEGALTQDKTSVTLSPLLPFTQYQVTVSPEGGPNSSIYVGTSEALPTEVPELSAQANLKTNNSITVFWDPVPVCSGFLLGYNYHLLKESENFKILDSGFTKWTNVSFHNLTVSTDYIVTVFITTIAGWNPQYFLTIKTSTSATVPEVVRNLTVYKRGRNTLGLRWLAPRATYGQLKSFTITYSLGAEESSHVVEPTPCVPWPPLYCYTIQGLKANRKYNISVSARNSEIAEDGEKVTVTEITKESSPSAPEDVSIINKTSTSVVVQWHYPDMANGLIRSFVVSVEETEKHDQDSCCQVYPLMEIPVQEEMLVYDAEVSGLHPASTYYVSVTAKTVGLGPSRALTVHTQPPHLHVTVLPTFNSLQEPVITSAQDLVWLPQDTPPEVNNSEVYSPLIKTHLLLAIPIEAESVKETGVLDLKLNSILQNKINKQFYFIGEYTQDAMVTDSEWGKPSSSSFFITGHTYQLVAVQVTEYNGSFNTDLCYSSSFTV